MVNSQLMVREAGEEKLRDVGAEAQKGPTEPVLHAQTTLTAYLAFVKENIEALRTMIKEHDQQAQGKGTPRRLTYDFDREAPERARRAITPMEGKPRI
ncbi:hypothetical protein Tco_0433952 [Tanacetum coccineum]